MQCFYWQQGSVKFKKWGKAFSMLWGHFSAAWLQPRPPYFDERQLFCHRRGRCCILAPLITALLASSAYLAHSQHTFECFIHPKGFNQLPDLLRRHASRSRPQRTLSVTSPTAPASHMPAGDLEVADGVDGDVLACVCTVENESVADGACAQYSFKTGVSVCLRGGALMVVTGVGSCVRGEVTRFSSAEVSAEVRINSNNR